uniref:Odorant receptor n=1 Tax=Sirex noctilio TaxID=36765 RepID=A0A857N3K4_9HYME|nr:odorant receptor 12 [Sirex noctilio]
MEASIVASRDLEFEIEWNRFLMRLIGVWPDQESVKNGSRPLNFNFLLAVFLILCFVTVPQSISLIMEWGNLDLVIDNLIVANLPITTGLFKLIIVWYNGKVLRLLLAYIAEDWITPKTKLEREVMLKNARTARILSMGGFLLVEATVGIHAVIQIFSNLQQAAKNSPDPKRHLLDQSYFPYNTNNSPKYELTFIGQWIASFFGSTSYSGTDTFLTMLVLHLCAQFTNLCYKLKNLVPKDERGNEEEIRKRLAIIVARQNRLNRFAASVENSFNQMFLVQMLVTTLQFCFQGYQVVSVFSSENGRLSLYQFVFLIVFVTCNLLQLFIYCYVGEKLNVESSRIGYAAYECEWYKLSERDARNLVFVMLRARKPLQITAGKFCSFSVSLFCDIVKTALGYLSVLLTVKDQYDERK